MTDCLPVSGNSAGIAETASIPIAVNCSMPASDSRGSRTTQSAGLPAVH